jgi:NADPH-dependent 2,4-dienoyl-CoA reductase/sulfur reductase-like enzyme
VRIRHEVIEIDQKNKRVKVKNIDEEKDFWELWDGLLITTGVSPIVPKMENVERDRCIQLHNGESTSQSRNCGVVDILAWR